MDSAPPRVVVSWEGPGEPIIKRVLVLAQELLTRGVQAIRADSWDAMYGQAVPSGFTSKSRGRLAPPPG